MSAGITPGAWASHGRYVGALSPIAFVAECGVHPTAIADASLIAEAGTVANETGLTPRQLADQRAELLAVLKLVNTELGNDGHGSEFEDGECPAIDKVRAVIAKTTGEKDGI